MIWPLYLEISRNDQLIYDLYNLDRYVIIVLKKETKQQPKTNLYVYLWLGTRFYLDVCVLFFELSTCLFLETRHISVCNVHISKYHQIEIMNLALIENLPKNTQNIHNFQNHLNPTVYKADMSEREIVKLI